MLTKKFSFFFLLLIVVSVVGQFVLPLSHKKQEFSPKIMKRSNNTGESVYLGGNLDNYGYFYATVGVGNSTYSLLLDTGEWGKINFQSNNLLFFQTKNLGTTDLQIADESCKNCTIVAPLFTRSANSYVFPCNTTKIKCEACITFNSQKTCGFNDSYANGA